MTIYILLILYISWKIYEAVYYKSERFLDVKAQIQSYVDDCNALNEHIENLKDTYIGANQLDYGQAKYFDKSHWNYKRPELKRQRYEPNIYNCSRTVCDNARKQPFKYICKYFNLKASEETLSQIENVLNNFEAAEQGKIVLKAEKERIIHTIEYSIPFLIRILGKKKFERKLGFENIDFSTTYFPKFIFSYVSSGGNASTQCDIIMNLENLNRFISYLSEVVKFKKSAMGQRALMTSSLRRKIMQRDNFTCKLCGNSTRTEPNLLLEIDHMIPISKGGLTTENNLRTLCWKCNRRKGSKIEFSSNSTKQELSRPTNCPSDFVNKQSTTYNPINSRLSEDTLLKSRLRLITVLKRIQSAKNNNRIANTAKITEVILAANHKDSTLEQSFSSSGMSNISQLHIFDYNDSSYFEKGEKNMYDKEKGIYPAGQYLVGRDIPLGGYILTARNEKTGYVQLYPSYAKYKKEEDAITYQDFTEDYHISLMEENTFLVIENADIQKI